MWLHTILLHYRVTVSISSIMNETTPMKLHSAADVAVYVSSLITQDTEIFARHNFTIRSIYIRMYIFLPFMYSLHCRET